MEGILVLETTSAFCKRARQLDAHVVLARLTKPMSLFNKTLFETRRRTKEVAVEVDHRVSLCSQESTKSWRRRASITGHRIDHAFATPHQFWVSSGTRYLFEMEKTQTHQCNHHFEVSESAFLKNWDIEHFGIDRRLLAQHVLQATAAMSAKCVIVPCEKNQEAYIIVWTGFGKILPI